MSDTREDAATSSGEEDPPASHRRRGEAHPPRATTNIVWQVVRIVMPLGTGAVLFLLFTLYLSLRA